MDHDFVYKHFIFIFSSVFTVHIYQIRSKNVWLAIFVNTKMDRYWEIKEITK